MNPIPEPDELLESECNAQGLYGLPEGAFTREAGVETRLDAGAAAPAPAGGPDPHPAGGGRAGARGDDEDA
jgi:hypothetical protein